MTSEVFGSGGGERLATAARREAARLACRSTRGSARPATPACRSWSPIPTASRRRRSPRSPQRSTASRGAGLHPHAAARLLNAVSEASIAARSSDRRWRRSGSDADAASSRTTSSRRSGRAATGHGLRRIEWLESWPELETPARPRPRRRRAGLRALGRERRARLPRAERDRRGAARRSAGDARGSSSPAGRSRPGCSATGRAASPTAGSSPC